MTLARSRPGASVGLPIGNRCAFGGHKGNEPLDDVSVVREAISETRAAAPAGLDALPTAGTKLLEPA